MSADIVVRVLVIIGLLLMVGVAIYIYRVKPLPNPPSPEPKPEPKLSKDDENPHPGDFSYSLETRTQEHPNTRSQMYAEVRQLMGEQETQLQEEMRQVQEEIQRSRMAMLNELSVPLQPSYLTHMGDGSWGFSTQGTQPPEMGAPGIRPSEEDLRRVAAQHGISDEDIIRRARKILDSTTGRSKEKPPEPKPEPKTWWERLDDDG